MKRAAVGLLALASICATASSGCLAGSGVAYIYMANDSAGKQVRNIFYTDSNAIYCVAKFSAGNPDSTLDFTIYQTGVYNWCSPNTLSKNVDEVMTIFAVGEQVPGVGTYTTVSEEILASGIQVNVNCMGYCSQNLPAAGADLCQGNAVLTESAVCREAYVSQGADSCGPGLTCCLQTVVSGSSAPMGSPVSDVPYPAGTYKCVVELNGVVQDTTDFSIVYPNTGPDNPPNPLTCPVPPPLNGIPCYNWFPENTKCPGYEPNTTCYCTSGGTWSCSSP